MHFFLLQSKIQVKFHLEMCKQATKNVTLAGIPLHRTFPLIEGTSASWADLLPLPLQPQACSAPPDARGGGGRKNMSEVTDLLFCFLQKSSLFIPRNHLPGLATKLKLPSSLPDQKHYFLQTHTTKCF